MRQGWRPTWIGFHPCFFCAQFALQIFAPQIIRLFLGDAAAPKVRVDCSVQLITEAVQIKHLVFLSLQVFRDCLLNAGRKIFFKAGFICRLTVRTARIRLVVRLYKLFQGYLSPFDYISPTILLMSPSPSTTIPPPSPHPLSSIHPKPKKYTCFFPSAVRVSPICGVYSLRVGAGSFGCCSCRVGAVELTSCGPVSAAASGFGTPWAHGVPAAVSETPDMSSAIAGTSAAQSVCGGTALTSRVRSHTGRMGGAAGTFAVEWCGVLLASRKTAANPTVPIAILDLCFICRISFPHSKTTALLERFLKGTVVVVSV